MVDSSVLMRVLFEGAGAGAGGGALFREVPRSATQSCKIEWLDGVWRPRIDGSFAPPLPFVKTRESKQPATRKRTLLLYRRDVTAWHPGWAFPPVGACSVSPALCRGVCMPSPFCVSVKVHPGDGPVWILCKILYISAVFLFVYSNHVSIFPVFFFFLLSLLLAQEYDTVNGSYRVTPEVLGRAKPSAVLMHPLPRVGEVTEDCDLDPRAAYFKQMEVRCCCCRTAFGLNWCRDTHLEGFRAQMDVGLRVFRTRR